MINRMHFLRLFVVAPLAMFTPTVLATPMHDRRAQMLILGTFHFNSKNDVFNPDVDDVLSVRRQAEIEKLVESLKRFQPTHIAIEWPADSPIASERFEQYLKGDYDSPNEVVQVGFRLAKRLGHRQVYPFDYNKVPFDYDRVQEFAKANGQQMLVEQSNTIAAATVAEINRRLQRGTVQDVLKFLNSPSQLSRSNSGYMSDVRIGKGSNYVGAQFVSDWYRRNLLMFANLLRVTSSSQDRVLVLVGSGHVPLLRQFANASSDLDLIDPLPFLGGER